MAKEKRRKKKGTSNIKSAVLYELLGLGLIAFSVITILKLGVFGKATVLFFRFFFGEWYIVSLIGLIALSGYFIIKRKWPDLLAMRYIGIYIVFSMILMYSHIALVENLQKISDFPTNSIVIATKDLFFMEVNNSGKPIDLGGGMVGALAYATLFLMFDKAGAIFIGALLCIVGLLFILDRPLWEMASKGLIPLWRFIKYQFTEFRKDVKQVKKKQRVRKERPKEDEGIEVIDTMKASREKPKTGGQLQMDFADNEITIIEASTPLKTETEKQKKQANQIKVKIKPPEKTVSDRTPISTVTKINETYQLPPLQLLAQPNANQVTDDRDKIYDNARKLERTFQSFGVKAKITKVHKGPSVTKYEVHPDVGVKVSKIVNLADDLALALAAKDIRIEAPIPGKSAVGIEVPNLKVATVTLREVLESDVDKKDEKLRVALGRDITGEGVFAELNKMPHLLVAGATGSGKSVCINGIVVSLLMRAKPHEVKLLMIDPKMVELNVYNGIPHLLTPVVTNPKRASQALKKIVNEMEHRYELFSHTGTRNIEGYNEYILSHNNENEGKQQALPYIVVIVDELADLMMVASSDVEDCITRLAQMARAAGIHLIIATQRPSVDVITGVIKANIPSRIAFSVSSQTDSRTILDSGGAEKLLGRGDMLFLPIGLNKPTRIQGAFLSDNEVEKVVEYVIGQQKAEYQPDLMVTEEEVEKVESEDVLYDEAVQLVTELGTASVSMLQRRFRIGYTRAARLIDLMELNGVVGPYEGSKPREVLIHPNSNERSS
ncbi:MAG: DNA translocase FtsK [Bacillaceae bacterium]